LISPDAMLPPLCGAHGVFIAIDGKAVGSKVNQEAGKAVWLYG